MEQIENYGDERQTAFCVYCGGATQTRDHVPSRVLLDEPFPECLPVVPACVKCNQSFCKDEEYVACLLECTTCGSIVGEHLEREKIKRVLRKRPALATRLGRARKVVDGDVFFDVETDRVTNVILKLARGHAAYELNEPQLHEPDSIAFAPLGSMPRGSRERFDSEPPATVWPEVGSRAMQRMARAFPDSPGWIIVQPDRYRYLTSVNDGVTVRMVIREYLACEVAWF
jgi:hypothetical protein